jgi:lysophospholipase L1-like esterase
LHRGARAEYRRAEMVLGERMATGAAPGGSGRRAALAKKLGCALVAALALFVLAIELLSRHADTVFERRRADPAFDPKTHQRDLWDRWARPTLDPLAFDLAHARIVPHPFLGYALKPSWTSAPTDPQRVAHNRLGFRGKETTWEKPAGTFRIVTLGGSSVYGSQDSSDESVWSARLERLLEEARPGRKIEVINGGCLGYNSFEMLGQFEFRLINFRPDLVLTYEAINDMKAALYTRSGVPVQVDNTHYRRAWESERASDVESLFEQSRTFLIWRRWFTSWGDRQLDLYNYVQRAFGDGKGSFYCLDGRDWPEGEVPEQGLVNYRRNLNSLISIADAAGVRVVLATQALVPRYMEHEECRERQLATFAQIQQIERDVARERAIPLCDRGQAIVDAVEREWRESAQDAEPDVKVANGFRWRLDKDGDGRWHRHLFHNAVHPYDDGSALIARELADWLLASGFLPQ